VRFGRDLHRPGAGTGSPEHAQSTRQDRNGGYAATRVAIIL
jgi:hypothetical protein